MEQITFHKIDGLWTKFKISLIQQIEKRTCQEIESFKCDCAFRTHFYIDLLLPEIAKELNLVRTTELFKVDAALAIKETETNWEVPVIFIESENQITTAEHEIDKLCSISAPLKILFTIIDDIKNSDPYIDEWDSLIKTYFKILHTSGHLAVIMADYNYQFHVFDWENGIKTVYPLRQHSENVFAILFDESISIMVSIKDHCGKFINKYYRKCDLENLSFTIENLKIDVSNTDLYNLDEAIVFLPANKVLVLTDRVMIQRQNADDEIDNNDIQKLKDLIVEKLESKFCTISVIPKLYSVDDVDRIKSPIGMCGYTLSSDVKILFSETEYIDHIINILKTSNINVRKFLPDILDDADTFTRLEENILLQLRNMN